MDDSGPGVTEPAQVVDVAAVVERVASVVEQRYVFPEAGAAAAAALRGRPDGYADLALSALCEALTADLRAACPDHHLGVEYRAGGHRTPAADELAAQQRERARVEADGIARVERLPGNVGLLDLRSIQSPELGGAGIAGAMTVLRNTFALLLDLRNNGGGWPDGVAYLCSFFLAADPVHLNSIHDREPGPVRQFWSLPYLSAPRYLDRPVYVLIGGSTFSGAEELAYNLQQLGRATLVGQRTRGGAHPVREEWVHPQVRVLVPYARSVNPVSGTNWEGVGVQPDVAVGADEAYNEAYLRALRDALAVLGDEPAPALRGVHAEASTALAQIRPSSSA